MVVITCNYLERANLHVIPHHRYDPIDNIGSYDVALTRLLNAFENNAGYVEPVERFSHATWHNLNLARSASFKGGEEARWLGSITSIIWVTGMRLMTNVRGKEACFFWKNAALCFVTAAEGGSARQRQKEAAVRRSSAQ